MSGLDERKARFAADWADAVAGTSYVPWNRTELVRFFRTHTDRYADALVADAFSTSATRTLGRELITAHFTEAITLGRTVTLLSMLPDRLQLTPSPKIRERAAKLLGDLALAYAHALQERTLDEQESIRRAAMLARREVEQALLDSEARFRTVVAGAPIGIGIGDLDGAILDVNRALVAMFGFSVDEFRQRRVSDFVHPDDPDQVWQAYQDLVSGERDIFRMEKQFFRRDGSVMWTRLVVALVRDDEGRPRFQVAMVEDATERRRLHQRLIDQASQDPQSGLPLRAACIERIAGRLTARSDDGVQVCCISVNGLDTVNERYGREVGDQLVTVAAERLRRQADRDGHFVARLGGSTFAVLLEKPADDATATATAERLVEVLAEPFAVDGNTVEVSAAAGTASTEPTGPPLTPERLLQRAEAAVRQARPDSVRRWGSADPVARRSSFDSDPGATPLA